MLAAVFWGGEVFLASAEALEFDRVLSEHVGAIHRIKFLKTLSVVY